MNENADYMSGRNQAKGNRIAMIISIILLIGFIAGFLLLTS